MFSLLSFKEGQNDQVPEDFTIPEDLFVTADYARIKVRSSEVSHHKSYIVSIDKIELIRSQCIKIGQNTVPISDSYYETFRQKVNI